MIYHDDELEPQLRELLGELSATPSRDQERTERARERYLAQVKDLTKLSGLETAVSPTFWVRLKGWVYSIARPSLNKERSPMFSTVMAIIVTITLLFGGTGATVFAAQNALPDQSLYPLKTVSENLRLRLAEMEGEPQGLSLYLDFATKRVQEMVSLTNQGKDVPARVGDHWDELMSEALAIAATEEDPAEVEMFLNQIREQLRDQDRLMVQARVPDHAGLVMERVQTQIRNHLKLVEESLEDPLMFKQHFRNRMRFNQPVEEEVVEPEEPISTEEAVPEEDESEGGEAPGNKHGSGDEFGPGPHSGPEGEDDVSGPGPGPQSGHEGEDDQSGPGHGGQEETPHQSGPGHETNKKADEQAPKMTKEPSRNGGMNHDGGRQNR